MNRFITWLNGLINKLGSDKFLHEAVGGRITATIIAVYAVFDNNFMFTDFILASMIAFAVVVGVSILKEKMDEKEDWGDLYAATFGWFLTSVFLGIVTLLTYL